MTPPLHARLFRLGLVALLALLADEADNPEQALARKAEHIALAAAVAALPLPFREVIVLREMEDLSYKEIARIAEVPVGTVMSRLSRARRLLRASCGSFASESMAREGDA